MKELEKLERRVRVLERHLFSLLKWSETMPTCSDCGAEPSSLKELDTIIDTDRCEECLSEEDEKEPLKYPRNYYRTLNKLGSEA